MSNRFYLAALMLISAGAGMAATLGQATTPIGSAFVNACTGVGVYASVIPGAAWNGGATSGGTTCNNGSGASVTMSSGSIPPTGNFDYANGTAQVGGTVLQAFHTGDSSLAFPDAVVNAGWNDDLTIQPTNPAYNGMAGYYVFPIFLNGALSTTGPDGLAQLWLNIYQNGQMVGSDYSAQDSAAYAFFLANNTTHNGPIFSSWDSEMVGYESNSSAPVELANATVWFAVPVTLGQQFELGVWVGISAGEGSSGASAGTDMAAVDPPSMSWGGPGYVVVGGNTISAIDITSQSGFNYNQAFTGAAPEPSCIVLTAIGLLMLFGARLLRERFRQARPPAMNSAHWIDSGT